MDKPKNICPSRNAWSWTGAIAATVLFAGSALPRGSAIAQVVTADDTDNDVCRGADFVLAGQIESSFVCRFNSMYSVEFDLADGGRAKLSCLAVSGAEAITLFRYDASGTKTVGAVAFHIDGYESSYSEGYSAANFEPFGSKIAKLREIARAENLRLGLP